MSDTKHTPGPWVAVPLLSGITIQDEPMDKRRSGIAEVRLWPGAETASANARLIAAAPELLEALKAAVKDCRCSLLERESGHLVDCFAPDALAAIAKAEGLS